jgi:hypothetical protein
VGLAIHHADFWPPGNKVAVTRSAYASLEIHCVIGLPRTHIESDQVVKLATRVCHEVQRSGSRSYDQQPIVICPNQGAELVRSATQVDCSEALVIRKI